MTESKDKLVIAAEKFLKENGYSAWTQATNAKFFLSVLTKVQTQKAKPDVVLGVMQVASNASAFRQKLEDAGVITKGAKAAPIDMLADLAL